MLRCSTPPLRTERARSATSGHTPLHRCVRTSTAHGIARPHAHAHRLHARRRPLLHRCLLSPLPRCRCRRRRSRRCRRRLRPLSPPPALPPVRPLLLLSSLPMPLRPPRPPRRRCRLCRFLLRRPFSRLVHRYTATLTQHIVPRSQPDRKTRRRGSSVHARTDERRRRTRLTGRTRHRQQRRTMRRSDPHACVPATRWTAPLLVLPPLSRVFSVVVASTASPS